MAYNKLAIETLTKKLNELLEEKKVFNQNIDNQIQEIHDGLISVGGTIPKHSNLAATLYDDQNPDYIKQSIEEI